MANLYDIFSGDNDEIEEQLPAVVGVAESSDPSQDLVEDLIKWLEEEKTEPPRKPGLHCSSLWKTCARKVLLQEQYKDYLSPEVLKAGSHMTFGEGHAIHDLMQNKYLGPFGRLIGDWKCLQCQSITYRGTMPSECPECNVTWLDMNDGHQNVVYCELFAKDEELDYCGHCDGVLFGRDMVTKRVFEFKTISKAGYASLRRPESSHVVQVHAYMHALGLNEAIILYWDKASQADWSIDRDGNFIATNPHLKSYLVKFDQELWDGIAARIVDHHKAVEQVRKLPVVKGVDVMKFERICTHSKCKLAKACDVKHYCFKLPG